MQYFVLSFNELSPQCFGAISPSYQDHFELDPLFKVFAVAFPVGVICGFWKKIIVHHPNSYCWYCVVVSAEESLRGPSLLCPLV